MTVSNNYDRIRRNRGRRGRTDFNDIAEQSALAVGRAVAMSFIMRRRQAHAQCIKAIIGSYPPVCAEPSDWLAKVFARMWYGAYAHGRLMR